MTMTVGMVYDLRKDYLAMGYSEADVAEFDSEETIDCLEAAIRANGFKTDRIGNVWALTKRLVAGEKWDLVFNVAEGMAGRCREAQVPAILEAYGVDYTFSDALVCAATLDKAVAKRLARDAGVATAPFVVVSDASKIGPIDLAWPLFVKPLAEGTGKGIHGKSCVETMDALVVACREIIERYQQPALVEEFLSGREMTIGILGNGASARVIGTMQYEVLSDAERAIYSYDVKENCETVVKYSPLEPGAFRQECEELALRAYRALECRDASRVDVRCDRKGRPCFMEVNPLAGLHPSHSDLPMIATQEGMSYNALIGGIIDAALTRLGKKK